MANPNQETTLLAANVLASQQDLASCVILPKGGVSVTKDAFALCSWLLEVYIPEGYECIEDRAFSQCDNLTKVHLSSSMTTIGRSSFQNCQNLKHINLKNVKHFGRNAFVSCFQLCRVNLSAAESIEDNVFFNCCNMMVEVTAIIDGEVEDVEEDNEHIVMDQYRADLRNLRTLGRSAFQGAEIFADLVFRDLTSVGSRAFSGSGVLSVDMNDCNFLTTIGCDAFQNCISLTYVTMTSTKLRVLRNRVFFNCCGLLRVVLPSKLQKISMFCFSYCQSLCNLEFPSTLITVGDLAFQHCEQLRRPTVAQCSEWTVAPNAFHDCLPPLMFENIDNYVYTSKTVVCSICHDNCSGDCNREACQIEPCKHFFHRECATKWYAINQTCANCRSTVVSVALVQKSRKRRLANI